MEGRAEARRDGKEVMHAVAPTAFGNFNIALSLRLPTSICQQRVQESRAKGIHSVLFLSFDLPFTAPVRAVEGSKGLREAPLVSDLTHATLVRCAAAAVGSRGCASIRQRKVKAGAMSFSPPPSSLLVQDVEADDAGHSYSHAA